MRVTTSTALLGSCVEIKVAMSDKKLDRTIDSVTRRPQFSFEVIDVTFAPAATVESICVRLIATPAGV